jgi:hypothetical protein
MLCSSFPRQCVIISSNCTTSRFTCAQHHQIVSFQYTIRNRQGK